MTNERNKGTVSTIDMINRRIEEAEKRGGDAFAGLTDVQKADILDRIADELEELGRKSSVQDAPQTAEAAAYARVAAMKLRSGTEVIYELGVHRRRPRGLRRRASRCRAAAWCGPKRPSISARVSRAPYASISIIASKRATPD